MASAAFTAPLAGYSHGPAALPQGGATFRLSLPVVHQETSDAR